MGCENQDVQGEKSVSNDAGEVCLDEAAKQSAWKSSMSASQM